MVIILIIYLSLLCIVARSLPVGRQGLACRQAGSKSGNEAFFRGNRRSPWLMVAFGMVGASVSGVSLVSVPGMVESQDMTYLQTCLGFILGYAIVAFVLLPIYYRLNLTSIYSLLELRLGDGAYRVATCCFIVSELVGTVVKFYLACSILQRFVFDEIGLSFYVTVPLLVFCIWLYTHRGGVRTLVLTDVLQTALMLIALVLIIFAALTSHPTPINLTPHTHIFEFSDFSSTQNFWRQFVSGAFIVVVMTGLNQNMMQKNLTCRTLRAAQKNMCLSGLLFVPVNALLLLLGAVLLTIGVPASGDALLPTFIEQASMGALSPVVYQVVRSAFVLGIASAAFSSADSSLTALTTSCCIDIARRPTDERLRDIVHISMALLLVLLVYALQAIGSRSLIDLVYTLVGYTYGPLLAIFTIALLTTRPRRALPLAPVAVICLSSPIITYFIAQHVNMGYELLLVNALIAFICLRILMINDKLTR